VSKTPSSGQGPDEASTTPGRASGATSRSRSRRTAVTGGSAPGGQGSFIERYRGVLLAVAAAAVIGLVAIFVLQPTGPAYACDSLLSPPPDDAQAAGAPQAPGGSPSADGTPTAAADATPQAPRVPPPPPLGGASGAGASPEPGASPAPLASPSPAPSPSPEPTPRLGFATRDLGRGHVPANTTVRYAFCPPTSGTHWNAAVRRALYGPGDTLAPGQWVHNLEHGYVVIAYRGEIDADALAQVRQVMDSAAPSDIAVQCGLPNKVMALRFDDMAEPWAVLAWDRALFMSEWDPDEARTFAEQWQDSPQTPEQAC
jgi:hypothetical protein